MSLLDPHELGKYLFLAANSNQTYGEFGFSYEVSVTLTGTGQTLTTGPLVDVFATDIGSSGGFKTFAAQSQQNTASLDIYNAAIAIPESWNSNGNGNYSDGTNWSQTLPNGLGFTAAFGMGTANNVTAAAVSVTINEAVYAGTLIFSNPTTNYTLASDGNSLHGIVLNNNGVGAAVNVTAGNPTIAANLTLADTAGTAFTIAGGSVLTISGTLADGASSKSFTVAGGGTLRVTSPPTPVANSSIVDAGELKFAATGGSANISNGVSNHGGFVSDALELAGTVPAPAAWAQWGSDH